MLIVPKMLFEGNLRSSYRLLIVRHRGFPPLDIMIMQAFSKGTSGHSCRGSSANSEWTILSHSYASKVIDHVLHRNMECAATRSALQWAVFHLLSLISHVSWREAWTFLSLIRCKSKLASISPHSRG